MNKFVLKFIGIIAVLITLTGVLVSLAIKSDFVIGENVLSDLGADERTANLFNFSLFVGGFLSILFFYNNKSIIQDSRISRIFFLVGSLGLVMLGMFPVYDATYWYFQRAMHWLGGLLFFVGFPLGMFTLGVTLKPTSFRKFSFFYAIFTIIVPIVLVFNNNVSILQFSVAGLIINWFFLFTLRVFRFKSIV